MIRRLLSRIFDGYVRSQYPLMVVQVEIDEDQRIDLVRRELRDFDHDGSGDVVEMAGVAVTAFHFSQHRANCEEAQRKRAEQTLGQVRASLATFITGEAGAIAATTDALGLIETYDRQHLAA